jgi:hypothetical protein
MKNSNIPLLLSVLLLEVLVSGCATEPALRRQDTAAPASEMKAGALLVLREDPRGRITYSWHSAAEFDLSREEPRPGARWPSGRILLAAASQRDCHQEFNDCIDTCMSRPLSEDYSHLITVGAKREYCRTGCWQPYRDCEEARKLLPQEFANMAPAVDWLKQHHNEVMAGSVVVIAGVVFVVAFPPGALLALIPVTLLASSQGSRAPELEVAP